MAATTTTTTRRRRHHHNPHHDRIGGGGGSSIPSGGPPEDHAHPAAAAVAFAAVAAEEEQEEEEKKDGDDDDPYRYHDRRGSRNDAGCCNGGSSSYRTFAAADDSYNGDGIRVRYDHDGRGRRRRRSEQQQHHRDGGEDRDEMTTDRKTTKNGHRRRRRGRRRISGYNTNDDDDDPSFTMLVFQVGVTLLALCLVTYHAYRWMCPNRGGGGGLMGSNSNGNKYQAEVSALDDDDDDANGADNGRDPRDNHRHDQQVDLPVAAARPTPPPLPTFPLSAASRFDAFGILATSATATTSSYLRHEPFWTAARGLRRRYADYYGGENPARMLLDRGTTTFSSVASGRDDPHHDHVVDDDNRRRGGNGSNVKMAGDGGGSGTNDENNTIKTATKPTTTTTTTTTTVPSDVVATACRFHDARKRRRPFTMAFGGYSVTAGRGNRHRDSYPLRLRSLLETVVKMAGIPDLRVTNAAIGGCPSFPYGWCMSNFWGGGGGGGGPAVVPDVVNWDYSMNESNGSPEGLEAYIRHLLSTYGRRPDIEERRHVVVPKLIVKDHSTAKHRRALLHEYSPTWLHDAVALHTDRIVQPFLARDEDFRPPGFRRWREWGAPRGAPGQALHHPAVQEHTLNAWILTMHFLSALEYMMGHLEQMDGEICSAAHNSSPLHNDQESGDDLSLSSPSIVLPPPVSGRILNKTDIEFDPVLFGRPINDESWTMNPVQCRTTFQPIRQGDLSDIVVSGTIGEDVDSALPKSQMYYNRGWTLDLSEGERAAKRRLSMYPDGLGFIDSKEAYYGIYESPHMKLLLPIDARHGRPMPPRIGDQATDWVDSIVLCEVNEKSVEPNKCNLDTDIGLLIGGANVTNASTAPNTTETTASAVNSKMIKTVGSVYLGKPICKYVGIPSDAQLTSHNHLLIGSGHSKYIHEDDRYLEEDQVGLLVEIYVTNPHIVHVDQACSISHVIWATTT